ncbi:MAG: hypothetical protein R3C24_02360 [Cyanobacteriota/Melainabacteria group bacterium]|nr:hypothetical protein [Candidatus Obscuribacterales bacterium]
MKKELFKVFDVKHKVELLIAFATGTMVGFSAGVASKVLNKLLEVADDGEPETGISKRKAEKLKDELENQPVVPS